MGPKTKNLMRVEAFKGAEGLRPSSLFHGGRICVFRAATRDAIQLAIPCLRGRGSNDAAYSAASASMDFGLAADIMKSLMRGTISDLKREPLNTP